MKKTIMIMTTVALLCGCSSLYKGVVTVTEVRDKAMTELARLNKEGKISAATDAKIAQADNAYRVAAENASKALVAYKTTGDKSQYVIALQLVKTATATILDILTPLVPQPQAVSLQTSLINATVP